MTNLGQFKTRIGERSSDHQITHHNMRAGEKRNIKAAFNTDRSRERIRQPVCNPRALRVPVNEMDRNQQSNNNRHKEAGKHA